MSVTLRTTGGDLKIELLETSEGLSFMKECAAGALNSVKISRIVPLTLIEFPCNLPIGASDMEEVTSKGTVGFTHNGVAITLSERPVAMKPIGRLIFGEFNSEEIGRQPTYADYSPMEDIKIKDTVIHFNPFA